MTKLIHQKPALLHNNPGNLQRHPKLKWDGQYKNMANYDEANSILAFTNIDYGIRALLLTIARYIRTQRCDTLRKLIRLHIQHVHKYQDAKHPTQAEQKDAENAVQLYAEYVMGIVNKHLAKKLVIDSKITERHLSYIAFGIIIRENGFCPFDYSYINRVRTFFDV